MRATLRHREFVAVEAASQLASSDAQSAFIRAVAGQAAPLDNDLWGPSPAHTWPEALRMLAAEVSALRRTADEWITTIEAAGLLDRKPNVIRRRLRQRHLVGLRFPGRWLLPLWQFTPLAATDVVPDLAPLQKAFPGDAVALSTWVLRDHVELGGRSPVEALLDGDTTAVLAVARRATAAAF